MEVRKRHALKSCQSKQGRIKTLTQLVITQLFSETHHACESVWGWGRGGGLVWLKWKRRGPGGRMRILCQQSGWSGLQGQILGFPKVPFYPESLKKHRSREKHVSRGIYTRRPKFPAAEVVRPSLPTADVLSDRDRHEPQGQKLLWQQQQTVLKSQPQH